MISVGVVGLGAMGQHHARLYSQLDCYLAGVADVNLERAREIGQKYKTRYYSDYHELLEKVQAVSIAVPTIQHHAIAMDFLARSVHCLVEKPIAFTVEQAEEMIGAAEKSHANLAVGHIEQYNPATIKLKQIINEGLLGDLLIISTRRVCPFVSRISDVGAVIDTAIHDIGVVKYLVGREPLSVFSRVGSERHIKEDYAVVVLDFGGTTACIEVNWFTPQKARTLVATGSEGVAYLNYIEQSLLIQYPDLTKIINIKKEEPLKIELQDFLNSIDEKRKPLVDGVEGKEVLRISLESSQNNYRTLYELAKNPTRSIVSI
ncbi:MAG: Gfo/Idh/MocA family oxidoreductase [Dehalococcoidales bacterium]|nr:Gfo/Idh/MocA family oxidoreductase [Dehalococcoidales bacterium]